MITVNKIVIIYNAYIYVDQNHADIIAHSHTECALHKLNYLIKKGVKRPYAAYVLVYL